MTHDVTFQPRLPPKQRRWRVHGRIVAFLGLLLINVGVFLHYGDPRARFPVEKVAPAGKAGTARGARASSDGARTLDRAADAATTRQPDKVITATLRQGQTMMQALAGAGVAAADVEPALASLRPLVDFRRLRVGHTLTVRLNAQGKLVALDIRRGLADQVHAEAQGATWRATKVEVPVNVTTTVVRGAVTTSLWDAMTKVGEDPRLAVDIAEIFAWDIDFFSDLQPGDQFTAVVEKRYVDKQLLSYGAITAARFVCAAERHEAFLHRHAQGEPVYYDGEGQSLRKQLLKSPLKYGHVTSGFGMRRHPVLGYSRAHNGIDYGVPTGTPVWAVGDARVLRAGWFSGYGKYVELRHANGWVSEYGHLSRVAVHAGQRVSQKDVIGMSGSTGLSTGPHLHYGLKLGGRFVSPTRQQFERAKPLDGEERQSFLDQVQRLRVELDGGVVQYNVAPTIFG